MAPVFVLSYRSGLACIAAIAAVLLAGCAVAVPPVEPQRSPSASADATATAVDPLSWPAQLYQGDCSHIADGWALGDLLGWDLPLPRHQLTIPVIKAGGIECRWDRADDGYFGTSASSLNVTVLPLAAVPEASEATSCTMSSSGVEEFGTCLFTILVGDVVFSGGVGASIGSTVADARASHAVLTQYFTSIAGNAGASRIRTRTADAWPATTDCVRLDEQARIAQLFGAAEMKPETNDYPVGTALVAEELAIGHGWTRCAWQSYEETTSGLVFLAATIYADGAWAAKELGLNGVPVDIAGADESFIVTTPSSEGDQQVLWLTRGSNLLALSTYWSTIDEAYPAAPVLLDALDTLN